MNICIKGTTFSWSMLITPLRFSVMRILMLALSCNLFGYSVVKPGILTRKFHCM
uniref:Heavy metal-associated domain containing protein n=1 Tax=Solanum tuberosum TaxID=4113 RepID=M1B7F3_SOLTU